MKKRKDRILSYLATIRLQTDDKAGGIYAGSPVDVFPKAAADVMLTNGWVEHVKLNDPKHRARFTITEQGRAMLKEAGR